MKSNVRTGPLQKLRVAALTDTNPQVTMASPGSPAAIPVGTPFVNYGSDQSGPSPFRGSLKDQMLTGADVGAVGSAFATQATAAYKQGGAATYAAGGAGDNIVISVQGGGNQTVDLSTTLAGRFSYMNALTAGLTGVYPINFDGKIRLVTTATGAAAVATIVSIGAAAGATTGLAAGAFIGGTGVGPQGTGATDLNTLTLQGPPRSPLSLTALFAWYDSKNFVLDKAGNVQTWKDRGPNGYHATQTTINHRPAHGVSSKHGREYLNLGGAQSLVVPNSPAKAQPVEVFAVTRSSTGTGGGSIVFDSGAGLQCSLLRTGTPAFMAYAGAALSDVLVLTAADHIVDAQFNGGAGNVAQDGKAGTTGAIGASGLGATMTIGSKGDGSYTFGFIGRIYEVIVCSALLSASDRLTLIGYLKSKYQIA